MPQSAASSDGYLLHSETALADLAQAAVDYARSLGAGEATAVARENAGLTIRASSARIDTAARDGSQALAITVYDARRTGRASTQALDLEAVRRAVEQAVAIARQVEPDDMAGLADPDWIDREIEPVPLFAPSGLAAGDLAETAFALERAALDSAAAGRVRVVDAGASSHDARWARAISHGFCAAGSASINHRWCTVIAQGDGVMARDYWSDSERRANLLATPETIGHEAASRALARLGASGLGTRRAPVLLDPRMAASLIGDLAGALNGMAQYQGRTYLLAPVGKELLAPHLSLIEDPFEPFGLASAAHDSEGVAASRRKVVANGMVQGLFVNTFAAHKLGCRSTGNADGPANLTLSSSITAPDDDLRAMWRRMGTGLWLTEFIGGGVNPVTGAYSKAATGFWIENGELSHPVQDFTVASDLPTMLRGIVAIGSDVLRSGGLRTGSILIDEMQIAGR